MNSISPGGTQKRPGRPRSPFVFALVGMLGVAVAAIPPIQPIREALDLDAITQPAAASPHLEAIEPPETLQFDRLASARGHERSAQPVPLRRLGSGTRRAVLLADSGN